MMRLLVARARWLAHLAALRTRWGLVAEVARTGSLAGRDTEFYRMYALYRAMHQDRDRWQVIALVLLLNQRSPSPTAEQRARWRAMLTEALVLDRLAGALADVDTTP